MGAIIKAAMWLLAGLGAGKLADKALPDQNLNVLGNAVSDTTGKFDWTAIAKTLIVTVVGGFILNMLLKRFGFSKYKLFSFAAWMTGLGLITYSVLTGFDANLIYGILIFTAPGGIGVPFTFNMNYLPEKIIFNDGGNPLTNLRIETQEDGVLHDWTAAAIAAMNGFLNVGALVANDVAMYIADGHLKNKNVTISGTTSAVGAIPIFVSSDNMGTVPFKTANANILANNDTEFSKFSALFLPNVVTATDRVQVFYKDGHVQIYDAVELAAWSVLYQDAPGIVINNVQGYIDRVLVTSALGGAAYVMSVKL
jgi:hypothetical protein